MVGNRAAGLGAAMWSLLRAKTLTRNLLDTMHKISPLLALLTAIMASSCVTESRTPRYGAASTRQTSVWERSFPDYESRRLPGYQTAGTDRYAPVGIFRSSEGGYRVYTGVSGIPDTSSLYHPAALPSSSFGYSQPERGPGYANAHAETRRLTGPSYTAPSPRSEVAPLNRSALPEVRDTWRRTASTSRAQSAADRLASANLSSKPSREPASRHDESKPEPKSSANQPAPDTNKLPFAQPVPGRTGFVKLSDHPNLPEIDVRGIAPGTPVEVPNPASSGSTIQFRVP